MLVIKRRDGESFVLDGLSAANAGQVTIKQLSNGRIGIEAPKEVRILRSELIDRLGDNAPRKKDPRQN